MLSRALHASVVLFVCAGVTRQQALDNDCGSLTISNNIAPTGWPVHFRFYRRQINRAFLWERGIGGLYSAILAGNKYKFSSNPDNTEFRLDILLLTEEDSGRYRVRCGDGTLSNELTLGAVVQTPSPPVFLHLRTFPDCYACLPALTGQRLTLACATSGGSLPVQMAVKKNGELLRPALSSPADSDPFSIVGTYTKVADETDDGAILTCEVNNPAIDKPLVTEAKIYLYKNPSLPVLTLSSVKAGSSGSITCVTSGGRPPPEVKFWFDGDWRNFQSDIQYDDSTRTYRATSTFDLPLNMTDNGKKISCGITHPTIDQIQSTSARAINVTFPPGHVTLHWSDFQVIRSGEVKVTLTCTVAESNPSSQITWTGLTLTEHKTASVSSIWKTFGWSTQETLIVTANRSKHREEVRCIPYCKSYPDQDTYGSYTFDIHYSPEISVSGNSEIVAYEGDSLELVCRVESNPVSAVAWRKNESELVTGVLGEGSLKLNLTDITETNSGVYVCRAENDVPPAASASVTLVVKDKTLKPDSMSGVDNPPGHILAAVVAAVILIAVVVVVIACVCKRKQPPKQEADTTAAQAEVEVDSTAQGSSQLSRDSHEIPEYASVLPKSQRVPGETNTDQGKEAVDDSCQLNYVELELPSPKQAETTKDQRMGSTQEPTEYVSIDFNCQPDSSKP